MRRRGTVSLKLMFAPGNLMRWPRRRYRPMHQALPPSFESPRIAGVLAELSLASRFDSAPRGSVLRAIETGPEISIASLQESRSLLVGAHHRAVGVESSNGIVWFWIGPHAEYDKL